MSKIQNLSNNFSVENLKLFLGPAIPSFKPNHEDLDYLFPEEIYEKHESIIKIGEAKIEIDELIVIVSKTNDPLTERSGKKMQYEIAKKILKIENKDAAIFVFYDGTGNFRFSFVRANYLGNKRDFSNYKRYTYFVSPNQTNKTFIEQVGKCNFKSVDEIVNAFSVEKLTQDFYKKLFAWYEWTLSEEVNVTFPNNTKTSEDDRYQLEEQIIRLITRLLFVWFIKQKKIVPDYLFDVEYLAKILKTFDANSKDESNYYNAILQNLFFATLNKEITERTFAKKINDKDIRTNFRYSEMFDLSEQEIINLFKSIPFLNGGLFECLDKTKKMDGVHYALDGFSRNPTKAANGNFKHRAFIPNCVFFDEDKGIIPLLKSYNFTVDENAPNEIQVALDPELLGKVFENLLGAFNPETKDTARKQSGSFYTPREIVDYMVNESLTCYLQTHFPGVPENQLQSVFQNEELPIELSQNHQLREALSNCLRQVKILDPACGSGAFPMGILNKMIAVFEKLTPNKQKSLHDLKLHLIEECIYGIDIQTIAVQISKLRFFISLVVEQEEMQLSKPEQNYGIHTLPNLETKFVAANTLIGIQRKPSQFNLFEDPEIETTKQALLAIRKEHFYAKTVGAKKRLREEDSVLRDKLEKLLEESEVYNPEDALQFSKWNPYDQNISSPFFDTDWMFGLQEGFDVVIGNPPYVEAKKLKHISSFLRRYVVYSGTSDLSSYFFEQGLNLCKPAGILSYINTNKFFNTGYGKPLRAFIIENEIKQLLNFEQVEVFENVLVSSVIISIKKIKPNVSNSFPFKKFYKIKNDEFISSFAEKIKKRDSYNQSDLTNAEWSFADNSNLLLKLKIENKSIKLIDIGGVSIYRGITTGFNPAFIINDKQREELIKKDKKNNDVIKSLLQGRNIRKWLYNESDVNLLQTGFDVNIKKEYPDIFEHLLGFEKELTIRSDQGKNWWNLRACKYYSDFEKEEKIIWGLTADKWAYAFDDKQHYLPSNGYILTSEEIAIKYLLALINSNLLKYYFGFIGVMTAGGAFTLKHATIQQLPFKLANNQGAFISIVNQILSDKKQGKDLPNGQASTSALEHQIDVMVYHLYELSYEEACVIDKELTKEDFEKYRMNP